MSFNCEFCGILVHDINAHSLYLCDTCLRTDLRVSLEMVRAKERRKYENKFRKVINPFEYDSPDYRGFERAYDLIKRIVFEQQEVKQ